MNRRRLVIALCFLVLLIDQSLKIWVKTHMSYGEEFSLGGQDWALIHFVENNGMAFGLDLGGAYGKLLLSVFRIIAVGMIGWHLAYLVRTRVNYGTLVGLTLIFAGALGNIIDSVFYGVLFSASEYHGEPAVLFPEGGGYAPLLYGRVVDMFYFPIVYGKWPEAIPFFGGDDFLFFSAIFNIADVAITLGVIILLYSFFRKAKSTPPEEE